MKPIFHVISNGKQDLATVERILSIIGSHIDVFHIREKHRSAREISQWVECFSSIGFPPGKLVINDRLDVAVAYGIGGIQLAYHSLSPNLARQILLPGQKIGVSVHSVEEARLAESTGANYILYGHVFPSGSKPGLAPRGLKALQDVVQSVKIPVIALGGIHPGNVEEVLSTGCRGIAVMSAVMEAEDPGLAVRSFRERMKM